MSVASHIPIYSGKTDLLAHITMTCPSPAANTATNYAIVFGRTEASFIIYLNNQVQYYVPAFSSLAAVIATELLDQASQVPGISNAYSLVRPMQILLNSWQGISGTSFAKVVKTSTGQNLPALPWQTISPAPGTTGVNGFLTYDPGCIVSPGTAATSTGP